MLSTTNGERGLKICRQTFLAEMLGLKKDTRRIDTTLGDDADGTSKIKAWPQKFRNGDLSRKNRPRPRLITLDFGNII
jgi:hypothetical protein